MTNVILTATTTIKTTVLLDWTSSQIVRVKINQPIPEYGLREGQVIYLVKSNTLNKGYQGDGTWYHILTWNYARMEWECPCKAYGRCKHLTATKQACATRVARCKAIAEKIVAQVTSPKSVVEIIAVNKEVKQSVNVAVKPAIAAKAMTSRYDAPLRGSGATGFGVQARLSASRKIANSVPMR